MIRALKIWMHTPNPDVNELMTARSIFEMGGKTKNAGGNGSLSIREWKKFGLFTLKPARHYPQSQLFSEAQRQFLPSIARWQFDSESVNYLGKILAVIFGWQLTRREKKSGWRSGKRNCARIQRQFELRIAKAAQLYASNMCDTDFKSQSYGSIKTLNARNNYRDQCWWTNYRDLNGV